MINFGQSELDREILLTPKHSLQVNGRILYFRPLQNSNITLGLNENIPWEQALKHVTFLTLNNHLNDATDLNQLSEYKKFMNASYIHNDLYIPKFGDIITLAKGRLESNSNGSIKFIEGLCNEKCDPKHTLAFWQVEKIRHRDLDKSFRYEIRLTVNTKINANENNNNNENIRSSENDSTQSESRNSEITSQRLQITKNTNVKRSQRTPRILRSFILKDNDYPNSFSFLDEHLLKRHNSATRTAYLDKLNAFNDIFTQPRYFHSKNIENDYSKLNIGEYFIPSRTTYPTKESFGSQSRISAFRPFITTTFRPIYNQKFSVPNNFPYPYHFENPNNYGDHLNHHEIITSVPSEYDIAPNPKITVHTHKPFDETRKSIQLHSHHHYYNSNFNDQSDGQDSEHYSSETHSAPPPYSKDPQSTIHLIEQPLNNHNSAKSHSYTYRTPPTITNQIPIPPSQAPVHYSLDTTYPGTPPPPSAYSSTRTSHFQDFRDNENKSQENFSENTRNTYTNPDTIYHSESLSNIYEDSTRNNPEGNKTPANNFESYDLSYYNRKPDSINAQLPPPVKGQDVNVPYVDSFSNGATETSITTELSAYGKKQQKIFVTPSSVSTKRALITQEQTTFTPTITSPKAIKSRTTSKRSGKHSSKQSHDIINTATTTMKVIGERSKHKIHRSTTERPVLKWKPKRGKITREYPTSKSRKHSSSSSKYDFEKVYVDEKTVTVTPSKAIEDTSSVKSKNIATKKSIATSITYKVGKDKLQKPFKPTIKIPNVEIVEANLVKLPTPNNEIKLFKATEGLNEKLNKNSKEEIELTETIVNHARNL